MASRRVPGIDERALRGFARKIRALAETDFHFARVYIDALKAADSIRQYEETRADRLANQMAAPDLRQWDADTQP